MGKTLSCGNCSSKFSHPSSLSRHKSTCGKSDNKWFKCSKCPKSFHRKDSLKRHIPNCKKGVEKPTFCKKCGKDFQTNWHLDRHVKSCIFRCEHCKKTLLNPDSKNHDCLPQIKVKIGGMNNKIKKTVDNIEKKNDTDKNNEEHKIDYYQLAEELAILLTISVDQEEFDFEIDVNIPHL